MARLLFVHAHPDDETLATGVAIAHHVEAGDEAHVLTCTLGDEGEVIPPELSLLGAAHDDRLGEHRRGELALALERLGAHGHLLGDTSGGPIPFRDSGMAGTASAAHPRAFVNADLRYAAGLAADVVRRVRPDIVVTYDAGGGYGHPDHVQTRRVLLAALGLLGDDELPRAAYEIVTPRTWVDEDRAWLAAHVPAGSGLHVPAPDEPVPVSVVADDRVTHVVVDPDVVARQAYALRAHRTQVAVHEGLYTLSNGIAARLSGREGFARIDPRTGQQSARSVGEWRHGLLADAT